MKIIKRFIDYNIQIQHARHEKGSGLIIVILVLAFLLAVGTALISVTGINSKVAGNIRTQHQAFNAAEAGFDSVWLAIENSFATDSWVSFDGHYLIEPNGIDNPLSVQYFRKLTDREILNYIDPDGDGSPDVGNVIFYRQPFISDGGTLNPRFTYTAFLIDDEAGGGTPDAADALLVCIGSIGTGSNMTTARLEIGLAIEISH